MAGDSLSGRAARSASWSLVVGWLIIAALLLERILAPVADHPKAAGADPKEFFDNRFIKELEDTGFVKELYGLR